MKKASIITLMSLLILVVASSFEKYATSLTQPIPNCDQGKIIAQKTWEKWGPWKSTIEASSFESKVSSLRNDWTWIVKSNGANIGPRRLEINGGNESGNMIGQSKSTFVTPPSFKNKVTITINKYDGKAATGVAICTHARSGVMKTVTTHKFLRSEDNKVKTFVINNARGQIITVAMENYSVDNKFKYRIKAI